MPRSALSGIVDQLRDGKIPSDTAIDELERTLDILKSAGWAGGVTADEALETLLEDEEEQREEETDPEYSG